MNIGTILKNKMREIIPGAFSKEEMPREIIPSTQPEEVAKRIAEYNEKILSPNTFPQFTAEEIYSKIEQHPMIKIDQHNRRVIKLLCLYFTNDERFVEFGGDLKRGLLLFGGVGVGKTTLMEFFRRNINHCYTVKPCAVIADEYARTTKGMPSGREIIHAYYDHLKDIAPTTNNFGQSKSGICFDDLGQEPETKHYGEEARIMSPIIEARYRIGVFNATHITTNLTAEMIGKTYGDRVRSRMAEMFNQIIFPPGSPDRRRQQ